MIVIDPGHGGSDPGAIGPTGLRESDVNLSAAFYLHDMLSIGTNVVLTREDDKQVSLANRVYKANCRTYECDAFISLHCNACDMSHVEGFEIYTSPGDTGADSLASYIFKSIINASSPQRHFRSDWSDADPDKEARFYVLTHTRMPAVLIELAFLSNPAEEQMLRDDSFIEIQARAITNGVFKWLNL